MRALFISWVITITTALGALSWISWDLHRAHVAEHNHARRAESEAELAHLTANSIARAQQALDQQTDAKLRQLAEAWERELGGVCLALETLARMHPGRARVPRPGLEVCGLSSETVGGAR